MTTGVYRILNTVTGKSYVGQSQNIEKRWSQHRSDLRNGVHSSVKLQRAFWKYGAEAFVYEICCECSLADINSAEQKYMDDLRSHSSGYNTRPNAESNRGHKFSEETLRRMSVAQTELLAVRPDVYHRKVAANRDSLSRPEVRAKIGDSSRAAHARPGAKEARSAAIKNGKATPEAKAITSQAAKQMHARPEVKARVSAAQKNRMANPRERANMSASVKAAFARPETKANLAAAMRELYADPIRMAALNAKRRLTFERKKRVIQQAMFDVNEHEGVEQ
jgi:group I intron endonuclease